MAGDTKIFTDPRSLPMLESLTIHSGSELLEEKCRLNKAVRQGRSLNRFVEGIDTNVTTQGSSSSGSGSGSGLHSG